MVFFLYRLIYGQNLMKSTILDSYKNRELFLHRPVTIIYLIFRSRRFDRSSASSDALSIRLYFSSRVPAFFRSNLFSVNFTGRTRTRDFDEFRYGGLYVPDNNAGL